MRGANIKFNNLAINTDSIKSELTGGNFILKCVAMRIFISAGLDPEPVFFPARLSTSGDRNWMPVAVGDGPAVAGVTS